MTNKIMKKLIGSTVVIIYKEMGEELALTGILEGIEDNIVQVSTRHNEYFIDINSITKIKIKKMEEY
jgi:hypothetical protein